ncbi:MAG: cbb3-type cytochrome oxidase subunit 3 [Limnohabitans sp.]
MDNIIVLRVTATVLIFVLFIGIVWWTIDRRKTRRFEEASRLPFLNE